MGRPPSNKRDRILASATDLFSRQRFQDVKLDQVAENAGVAKGTIYLYFKSKEDLLCECLLEDTPEWRKRAEKIIAGKGSATNKLRKMVQLQAEAHARKGPLIQQMVEMGPTFPLSPEMFTRLRDHLRSIVAINARLFQQGIEAGEFTDRFSSAQMSVMFFQLVSLEVKFNFFNVPQPGPDDLVAAMLKLFKPE